MANDLWAGWVRVRGVLFGLQIKQPPIKGLQTLTSGISVFCILWCLVSGSPKALQWEGGGVGASLCRVQKEKFSYVTALFKRLSADFPMPQLNFLSYLCSFLKKDFTYFLGKAREGERE